MRLFLGIEIPQEIKKKIHSHLKPIQITSKGWELAHDYHLTLLFIGEIQDPGELPHILSKMGEIHFKPFQLSTCNFEFFNRRVLYLSFDQSSELIDLKLQVDQAFPFFLKPESKPFLPHVTIKRWQRYEFDHLKSGLEMNKMEKLNFKVTHLSLFKSEKDEAGRKYHIVNRGPSY